jgi:hypothetical protein
LPVSEASSGNLTFLSWSPDGYCLFAGYDRGWAMWSVYGKLGANTFGADRTMSESNDEEWLCGVRAGFWIGGGAEILLLGPSRRELHVVEMMRSSVTSCFTMSNISRSLLQGSTSLMLYRGFETSDHTTISGDISLWQTIQVPQAYLAYQWPLRLSVVSSDARYLAVAGRRGLAHYSVGSGRWKTFEDPIAENSFTVRGGMCWWQHILVAAVESGSSYEVCIFTTIDCPITDRIGSSVLARKDPSQLSSVTLRDTAVSGGLYGHIWRRFSVGVHLRERSAPLHFRLIVQDSQASTGRSNRLPRHYQSSTTCPCY